MALSVRQTTNSLPILRGLLDEWDVLQLKQLELANSDNNDAMQDKDVVVAFRMRPPLPEERHVFEDQTDGDDDGTEFLRGITVTNQVGRMFVHVPNSTWKGHNLAHKEFTADVAFGPESTNDQVYEQLVQANSVIDHALNGGVACILAYGQTGTGKTYTVTALEERLCENLFARAESLGETVKQAYADTSDQPVFTFDVTFLEVLGKFAADLSIGEAATGEAEDLQNRPRVEIMEDKLGQVRPKLAAKTVTNAQELQELITRCLSHRRTSATARNDRSSRSHALLNIRITNRLQPQVDEGQIIMVDLAGSERYTDSRLHSRERLEENKETNKSLMTLKDCVQARAKAASAGFVHIPYRSNKLTLLLKALFDLDSRQPTKTIVIAHVSPHIQDAAHSANTLSYAAPFRSVAPKLVATSTPNGADPRSWDHAHTINYLTRGLQHEIVKVFPGHDISKLPVDLEAFLPAPRGGLNLCKMYGAEWVSGMLKASEWDGVKQKRLEKAAFAVYVAFSERLRVARTQGRKEVFTLADQSGYRESFRKPAGDSNS